MQPKARRWFLTWGMLIAVFGVRGILPWLIVWVMAPGLGPWQAFTASITGDARALAAIRESAPVLLVGGAVFFLFLFFHWLFMEPKSFGLPGERLFARQGAWFYAIASVLLTVIVWFALNRTPMLAFGAVMGSTTFFIMRELTYHGVGRIKHYIFLKNGAMYSVLLLGVLMLAHGFGIPVPEWLSPVATFLIVGYFFMKSFRHARRHSEGDGTRNDESGPRAVKQQFLAAFERPVR